MFSSVFCGSRAADLAWELSDCSCIAISSVEVMKNLSGMDQICRRLVNHAYRDQKNASIIFLVEQGTSIDDKIELSTCKEAIDAFMNSVNTDERVISDPSILVCFTSLIYVLLPCPLISHMICVDMEL